ncbi:MAG: DUF6077 domain-containing protein [Lachnospiraceae bacterium]|nr:DUF6077 domain-containing protein [Lachnospiraceae bacterium]
MLSVISLIFWLLIIPFCIGLVPANFISPYKRNPGVVILAGYFCMWAVFEVVTIPAVLFVKYHNFSVAADCFTVISILCAIAGLLVWYRNTKNDRPGLVFGADRNTNDRSVTNGKGILLFRNMTWPERIEWLLFAALIGFQLYKAVAYASFDGDDAYYVVESLLAQQADVMYRILPYTGRPTDLDVRHVLAVFPMWVAFVSVKSGIHATIVSHVVMPVVLIPLTYLVYFEIGRILFPVSSVEEQKEDGKKEEGKKKGLSGQRENLPIFMILMCLFQIFGNVSIYTNETFFLTRTWQGKAVTGSLVIPAFLWLFLWIYDGVKKEKKTDAGLWLLLVCINMTAGICSSIAVFIVSILIAVTAFCLMLVEKDFKVLLKIGATCIPNVIYMGIYVIMAYSYLLG